MTSKKSLSGSEEREGATESQSVLASSALAGGKKKRSGADGKGAAKPSRTRAPRQSGARFNIALHDFWVAARQLVPLLLAALAVFCVAMPISTAAIPDTSIFNLDYTHDQMKFRFWAEELTYLIVVGATAFGLVVGVRGFRFMLVKREATAVLSLPMPRATLFATRMLACIACVVLGIAIPMVASLAVNIVALDVWTGLFSSWAYVLAGLLVTAGIGCAVGALSCALAGTQAEAAMFGAALLGSVSVAAWGLNAVMEYLLVGNAFGATLYGGTTQVAPALLQATSWANPVLFFAEPAASNMEFIVQHPVYAPEGGNWVLVGAWVAVLVALLALACVTVCRRRGERAGIAGLSPALSVVVGVVVGLAAFGATFTLLASVNVAAACVAAFAALWLVAIALLRGPLRGRAGWGRTLSIVGAQTAAVAAALAAVAFGGFGYASVVPSASNVQSVTVSYAGTPSYLAAPFESAQAGDGSYYFSAEYSFSDEDAISIVCDVHQQLVGTGRAGLAADRMEFGDSVVPYDVVIRYTLSDGSELVRYYDRATYSELYQLAQLDDTRHAAELSRAVISGDVSMLSDDDAQTVGSTSARQAFALGDIYVSDALYAKPMLVNCDAQARAELLAALAEDVAAQSAQDRYHPSGQCLGVVMFTRAGESAANTFAYGIENSVVYLTSEFTNTLAWFESKGLSAYIGSADASQIESMTFQRYAPYEAMNKVTTPTSAYFMGYASDTSSQFVAMMDWGTKFSTTDEGQIAELMPLCRNAYYMDGGGYLVSCKLSGQAKYAYLFIPAEDAPEWLIRVAG